MNVTKTDNGVNLIQLLTRIIELLQCSVTITAKQDGFEV
jgi:hypothetical protein